MSPYKYCIFLKTVSLFHRCLSLSSAFILVLVCMRLVPLSIFTIKTLLFLVFCLVYGVTRAFLHVVVHSSVHVYIWWTRKWAWCSHSLMQARCSRTIKLCGLTAALGWMLLAKGNSLSCTTRIESNINEYDINISVILLIGSAFAKQKTQKN